MGIAHELITRGWCQHALENERGEVCLLGAALKNGTPYAVVDALLARGETRDVAEWNNAPETTFDDVLRVAKEADEILGL